MYTLLLAFSPCSAFNTSQDFLLASQAWVWFWPFFCLSDGKNMSTCDLSSVVYIDDEIADGWRNAFQKMPCLCIPPCENKLGTSIHRADKMLQTIKAIHTNSPNQPIIGGKCRLNAVSISSHSAVTKQC